MNRTKIEWVKNPDDTPGYTWNPITGCLNGCEYCYARRLANTRLRERYLANQNIALPDNLVIRNSAYSDPFYPRFWPERVRELIFHIGMRSLKGIFVCDMSDLFGIGIPEDWTEQVLSAIRMDRRHRFYLLTKQPQNLIKWSQFPDNCWVGVTATDTEMSWGAMEHLWEVEAKVKYISYEPLLNGINLQVPYDLREINWVIIGAQTKPYKPPKLEWVQEIVEACDKAGIPVFLKDNLRPLIPFTEANSWLFESIPGVPTGIKLRQELPKE